MYDHLYIKLTGEEGHGYRSVMGSVPISTRCHIKSDPNPQEITMENLLKRGLDSKRLSSGL